MLMDWKQQYVLSFRELEINEEEVLKLVQDLVNDLSDKFKANNLEKSIAFNVINNSIILPYHWIIKIEFYQDKSCMRFTRLKKDDKGNFTQCDKLVDVVCVGGFYRVYYSDKTKKDFIFMDDNLIDTIIEDLVNLRT